MVWRPLNSRRPREIERGVPEGAAGRQLLRSAQSRGEEARNTPSQTCGDLIHSRVIRLVNSALGLYMIGIIMQERADARACVGSGGKESV